MDNNVMNTPNDSFIPDNVNNNVVMTKTEDVVIHLKVNIIYILFYVKYINMHEWIIHTG